jgi:hypothetical protein
VLGDLGERKNDTRKIDWGICAYGDKSFLNILDLCAWREKIMAMNVAEEAKN